MLGKRLKTREELAEGSRELQEKGARNILVSLGRDGAFFLSENGEELWINAPKGTVINTVGSGDSMVAGFISSRECGKSLRECACYAVAAGSAGAFSELLPERGRTEQLYREISENQLA